MKLCATLATGYVVTYPFPAMAPARDVEDVAGNKCFKFIATV